MVCPPDDRETHGPKIVHAGPIDRRVGVFGPETSQMVPGVGKGSMVAHFLTCPASPGEKPIAPPMSATRTNGAPTAKGTLSQRLPPRGFVIRIHRRPAAPPGPRTRGPSFSSTPPSLSIKTPSETDFQSGLMRSEPWPGPALSLARFSDVRQPQSTLHARTEPIASPSQWSEAPPTRADASARNRQAEAARA